MDWHGEGRRYFGLSCADEFDGDGKLNRAEGNLKTSTAVCADVPAQQRVQLLPEHIQEGHQLLLLQTQHVKNVKKSKTSKTSKVLLLEF